MNQPKPDYQSDYPSNGMAYNRQNLANRRKRAANISVVSNTCLILAKLGVGLAIGSISVISEAIHSSVDLIAAIIALIAVRIAAHPADESHPYGHGKVENLSGVVESLLIFAGAGLIIFEAISKFGNATETTTVLWGVAVMALSAIINVGVSRYLFRVATETDSIALKADAAHLSTDVITSAGVMVGLALVWISGWSWLDPLTALVVALLIIKAGWDILIQSGKGLLDNSLPAQELSEINQTIEGFSEQYVNYHQLRARQSGPERHLDFHLVVSNEMAVEEAHNLCNLLEVALQERIRGSVIDIHLEPQSVCNPDVEGVYNCNAALSKPSRFELKTSGKAKTK